MMHDTSDERLELRERRVGHYEAGEAPRSPRSSRRPTAARRASQPGPRSTTCRGRAERETQTRRARGSSISPPLAPARDERLESPRAIRPESC
jgi:hypothetical protein